MGWIPGWDSMSIGSLIGLGVFELEAGRSTVYFDTVALISWREKFQKTSGALRREIAEACPNCRNGAGNGCWKIESETGFIDVDTGMTTILTRRLQPLFGQ
jgi:hypothetical protein